MHERILEESNEDSPNIQKKGANDEFDEYFVQRAKYERKIVLNKEGVNRRPWADVIFRDAIFQFYCTFCEKFLGSASINYLRDHEKSPEHVEILQRKLEKDADKLSKSE